MHPTEVLSNEHRVIEQVLDALENQIENLDGNPFPRAFFDQALDFFRNFADGIHHAKEERQLFPLMVSRGVPSRGGPIGVMLGEHDQGRTYLAGIREHLDAAEQGSESAAAAVREYAEAYIQMLRQHIRKEDNILFRMAQMVLTPEDVEALAAGFGEAAETPRYRAFAAGVTAP